MRRSRDTYRRENDRTPRRVYVARTLVEPQDEVNKFLNTLARYLVQQRDRRTFGVSALGALHMTLLESAGTTPAFRQRGYTPNEVRRLSIGLQQYLANIDNTRKETKVEVDPDNPLRWYGRQANRLALNVTQNPDLQQERLHIEAFLLEHFGAVPELRALDEHVAIASFNPHTISPEARCDPTSLLPRGIVIPKTIALNGLMVFLNGIGGAGTVPVARE